MALPDVRKTAGPLFVGILLNWGLFGALSIQLYFYYLSFPNDRWGPILLVAFIYLVEATQTFVITRDCFQIYVVRYGDVDSLNDLQLEGIMVPANVVSSAVQLFYAYRLYMLFKKRHIVVAICSLTVLQLFAGIFTGIHATLIGTFSGLQSARVMQIGQGLWLVGSALCDTIIATSMIYLLLRTETKNRATHNLINKLVRLVIETGSLTAVMATLSLVLYYAFPGLPYHVPVATALSKLYSNSALAIFNSRIRIIGGRDSATESSKMHISLGGGTIARPSANTFSSIRVQEDVYVHMDDIPLEYKSSAPCDPQTGADSQVTTTQTSSDKCPRVL